MGNRELITTSEERPNIHEGRQKLTQGATLHPHSTNTSVCSPSGFHSHGPPTRQAHIQLLQDTIHTTYAPRRKGGSIFPGLWRNFKCGEHSFQEKKRRLGQNIRFFWRYRSAVAYRMRRCFFFSWKEKLKHLASTCPIPLHQPHRFWANNDVVDPMEVSIKRVATR